jgi:hypothetical protein
MLKHKDVLIDFGKVIVIVKMQGGHEPVGH